MVDTKATTRSRPVGSWTGNSYVLFLGMLISHDGPISYGHNPTSFFVL
jgi:hypothetical protein